MIPLPEIAVVIVSYNTRELLLECLASVIESARQIPAEIITVDNDSKDGSAEAVRELYPDVKIIANRVNLGFGAACNQAIKASRAPFILLLNSDARVTTESLRILYNSVALNEGCGASGCRLVDDKGCKTVNTRNFLTPFNQALELTGITKYIGSRHLSRTYHPGAASKPADCSVDWIDGACLMLKREALDQIGLFDEQFFMYSEDEDLCMRLRKRGWSICYSDEATAVHYGGRSSVKNRCELLRQFYFSQMLFLYKHRSQVSVLLFAVAMIMVLAIKRAFRMIAANDGERENMAERFKAFREAYQSFSSRNPGR